MDKLQIYYQPIQDNPDHLKSLTISFYDFDEVAGTYKKKIVLEQDGSKDKIKNVCTGFLFYMGLAEHHHLAHCQNI